MMAMDEASLMQPDHLFYIYMHTGLGKKSGLTSTKLHIQDCWSMLHHRSVEMSIYPLSHGTDA